MTDVPSEIVVSALDAPDDRLAHETGFVEKLAAWLSSDNGKAAVLRRSAGNTIAESRNVNWFFDFLNTQPIRRRKDRSFEDEELYFMTATLFAMDKVAIDGKKRPTGNFGATLRLLRRKSGKADSEDSPLDRRFNVLLDSDFDPTTGGELPYRLRQLIKRVIAAKDPGVRVNWPQLLYDAKHWNSENKRVQKSWARGYYAPALEPAEGAEPKSGND